MGIDRLNSLRFVPTQPFQGWISDLILFPRVARLHAQPWAEISRTPLALWISPAEKRNSPQRLPSSGDCVDLHLDAFHNLGGQRRVE